MDNRIPARGLGNGKECRQHGIEKLVPQPGQLFFIPRRRIRQIVFCLGPKPNLEGHGLRQKFSAYIRHRIAGQAAVVFIHLIRVQAPIKFSYLFNGESQRLLVGGNAVPQVFNQLDPLLHWELLRLCVHDRTSVVSAGWQLVEKLLRQPSASLCGARSLAYRFDMSRSLRAPCASQLATSRRFFNKLLV
jgi:hypothetical protein